LTTFAEELGSVTLTPDRTGGVFEVRVDDEVSAAVLRLKRVIMTILAAHGVDLPIPPDGPVVRMVNQKMVREAFYACTPVDGTPKQVADRRRNQFDRACAWADQEQLVGIREIDGKAYFWLNRPNPEPED
jgi:hypothetical protein